MSMMAECDSTNIAPFVEARNAVDQARRFVRDD